MQSILLKKKGTEGDKESNDALVLKNWEERLE